jgi:phosphoglycolate phosphatase-like HAD superfamily hydrolase
LARSAGLDPNPEDCLVIGDTPLDVAAAHLAGARALAVATGSYGVDALLAAGADAALADLSDTQRVLDIALSG